MKFVKYTIRWIASNLSIPFWTITHVAITVNVYHDIVEICSSLGMNILVAIGFWLEWLEHKNISK
jgi:hypothetical protein